MSRPASLVVAATLLAIIALASRAQAQPCRSSAGSELDGVRLARDTRVEIEQTLLRSKRQLQERDRLATEHAEPFSFHAGFDVDLRGRNFYGFTVCDRDGYRRSALVSRSDTTVSAGFDIPKWDLSLRVFTRSERLTLQANQLRDPEAEPNAAAPPPRTVAGSTRSAYGGTLQVTEWVELSGAWLTAESAMTLHDRDSDISPIPAPNVETSYLMLGAGIPRFGLIGDLLVDPATGDISDARLRLRDAPVWITKLDLDVGWRAPKDEFYTRINMHRLFDVIGAGVDVVPFKPELRSAWTGVGHHWGWGIGGRDVFPDADPVSASFLLLWGFVDASVAATTYRSDATVAYLDEDARLAGVDARLEAGIGIPFIGGMSVGLSLEGGVNRPQTLEAMPFMANRFEIVGGFTVRVGP